MIKIDKSHPRYKSLTWREKLVDGVTANLTSLAGLTAHGRGEAFDYLLGEETQDFAKKAIETAAAYFVLAHYPVISVNGNTAALSADELVTLATTLDAPLEINLFHPGKQRETAIEKLLKKRGAKTVLKPDGGMLNNVRSNRQMISSIGQKKADLIFVPLEDGDRTEALITMGKKVITIDLNPLSRTSMRATVTIVDHIARSLPLLIDTIKNFQTKDKTYLEKLIRDYSNEDILKDSLAHIIKRLTILSKK